MVSKRQNMPRLSRLRVFEASALHLSFTEAAYELGVTQAAVSQQIRLLEQELDIVLFERLNRGLATTEEGHRLLIGVSHAFDLIEMATVDALSTNHNPVLRIGVTFSIATFWLIRRLDQFQFLHPDINVRLIATDQGFDDIADQIDVGIAFGKGVWSGLQSKHLYSPKIFPVCSPDYFSKIKASMCVDDLVDETLLSIDKHGISSEGDWRNWLSQLNIDPSRIRECISFNSHPLLVQATCAGQGIALGWSLLTDDLIDRGHLVRVTNEETSAHEDFYYVEGPKMNTHAQECFKEWLFKLIAEN